MNIFKVLILVVISFSSIFANEQLDEEIKDSIVKIYTVSQVYNYNQPWNVRTVRTSGSGCIIKGNRILTNARIGFSPVDILLLRDFASYACW